MGSTGEVVDVSADANNNRPTTVEKCYSLRPRSSVKKEDDSDGEEILPTWKSNRGRSKRKSTAPLSKYRRKTANARERSRMREINDAFESLRRVVQPNTAEEKITKIATLRLAMRYIAQLTDALNNEPESSDAESMISGDSSNTFDTLGISDQSLTPPLLSLDLLEGTMDSELGDTYADFTDSPLTLDHYDDFATFSLDDVSFSPDFS